MYKKLSSSTNILLFTQFIRIELDGHFFGVFEMNIPTEHFQNIPVHTLSPIPLSPETLDLLKVYER